MITPMVYLIGILCSAIYIFFGSIGQAMGLSFIALILAEVWHLFAIPLKRYDTWGWRFRYMRIIIQDYWWEIVLDIISGCSATALMIVLCILMGGENGC